MALGGPGWRSENSALAGTGCGRVKPHSMLYGVTAHLELLPSIREPHDSPHDTVVLATNLLTGRRLRAPLEPLLELLERHRQGATVRGELAERAVDSDLLRPIEQELAPCDQLGQLDRALSRFLGQPEQLVQETVLEKLEQVRERFVERAGDPQIRQKMVERTLPHHQVFDEEIHFLWHDSQRLVSAIFNTVHQFVQREWKEETYDFDVEFLRRAVGRPRALLEYEQQPCLLVTTLERRRLAPAREPFLVLGDDDLMSVALTVGAQRASAVDVFELDERLLEFLQGRTLGLIHARDLTHGLPEEFWGRYGTIFTDPMYMADGMHCFIGCCRQGLATHDSRVYLTTCPDQLQDPPRLWRSFQEHGLEVRRQWPAFSRYRFPETPRGATLDGLTQLGFPAATCYALLSVPYLYADMFELTGA